MRGNIALNRTGNVVCEQGDVNSFASKYRGFADRIVMPLPKDAYDFLPSAIRMSARRCTIHCYMFCQSEKVKETISKTRNLLEKKGARVVGVSHRIVRPYSSTETEIVLDIRVNLKKS
jgi:tRNA (guanine37-N1)-methyltransferase